MIESGLMPSAIDLLASEILRLNDRGGVTPVLVTPMYFSLRTPFFLALATKLARESARSVRIDWYRPSFGFSERMAEPLARSFVKRLNRSLLAVTDARMEITSTIGRPGGPQRELVIGYCRESAELPPWASPILLASRADGVPLAAVA